MPSAPEPESRSLPTTIPVFPLPGVLLLPRARLPLNIFEPRYLAMTEDAMSGERIIGMVQPRVPEPDPVSETAELYETGCAGRIDSFTETGDGRYLITLQGVVRFRIDEELPGVRGYRRVAADYEPYLGDLETEGTGWGDRTERLALVRAYFAAKGLEADLSPIEDVSDESLVTALAMMCPFEPGEKQALLECPGLAERGAMLTTLMEMAVRGDEDAGGEARH